MIFLAPQGLDQEYILHKPPAAQVLMEPSQPLTGHLAPTFILQRQTWELEYQDIRRNGFLVPRTKPATTGFEPVHRFRSVALTTRPTNFFLS